MKKEEDFKIPFTWEERRPLLMEKCLYLPKRYVGDAHLGKEVWRDAFAQKLPLGVEFCSGNGQWIAEMAKRNPQLNWVAVERDFGRARKIWLRLFRYELSNLFVVCGEALEFSRRYLSDHCVAQAWVNFPDPWPKRYHAKHRLIQKPFAEEMRRILASKAPLTLATDDEPYSIQIDGVFSSWKSAFTPHRYVNELPEYGTSYFHALWLQKQRTIRYQRFFYDHDQ